MSSPNNKPDFYKELQTCAITLWSAANNSRRCLTNRHAQCINAILATMKGFDPDKSHDFQQIVPLDSSRFMPEEYLSNEHLAGLQTVLKNLEQCLINLNDASLVSVRKKPDKAHLIHKIQETKTILQNDFSKVRADTAALAQEHAKRRRLTHQVPVARSKVNNIRPSRPFVTQQPMATYHRQPMGAPPQQAATTYIPGATSPRYARPVQPPPASSAYHQPAAYQYPSAPYNNRAMRRHNHHSDNASVVSYMTDCSFLNEEKKKKKAASTNFWTRNRK